MVYVGTSILLSTGLRAQASVHRERTNLEIALSAAEDLNPDDKSRPSPILVRLYELRSAVVFEKTDYFSFNSNDRVMLGEDLLVRDEMILRPGEKKYLRRKSHPDIEALGWVAGYRNLAQADWRTVVRVEPAPEHVWYRAPMPANKVRLSVNFQRYGIQVLHEV